VQNPIRLDGYNEPQPDLALVRWQDDFYAHQHPTPADVLIAIEVANTSLVADREEKLPRYARAAIPEVWLVNIGRRIVEQYSQPVNGNYVTLRIVSRGQMLTAQTLAGLELPVDLIFG
jgi:Uma2 family endonuclease